MFYICLSYSELVASHITSKGGFGSVIPFLEHPEVEHRVFAFKLTRLISEWFSQYIANELRLSNKLTVLKEKLLNNQSTSDERSDAAQILANLSLSEGEIQTLLGGEFVELTAFKVFSYCIKHAGRTYRSLASLHKEP